MRNLGFVLAISLSVGACGRHHPVATGADAAPPSVDLSPASPDLGPPAPDLPPPPPDQALPVDLASPDLAVVDAPVDVPPLPPTIPGGCLALGINNLAAVETRLIAPRCGGNSACHQAIFPPRNLNNVAMIRSVLVGKKSMILCKGDSYIDTSDFRKSFMLTKVLGGDQSPCPSGGREDSGGSRMPNKIGAPAGTVDDPLSVDELACYTWWVSELARGSSGVLLPTCHDLRACVFQCPDQACISRCYSWASPSALAAYNALDACGSRECPRGDNDCRCTNECRAGALCAQELERCDGVLADPFCEAVCH